MIERIEAKAIDESERAAINSATAGSKTKYKLMNWPPSRGPMPKSMRDPKTVPARITIKMVPDKSLPLVRRRDKVRVLDCDIHVETLLGMTLDQADRVLSVADHKSHNLHSIMLKKSDLAFKKGKPMKVGVSYKRAVPDPPTLVADIDYPLSKTARVVVPPFKRHRGPAQSWGHFLWQIARAYDAIYKEWKKWGVWGHALGDLWFEEIEVTRDGRVVLGIGS